MWLIARWLYIAVTIAIAIFCPHSLASRNPLIILPRVARRVAGDFMQGNAGNDDYITVLNIEP